MQSHDSQSTLETAGNALALLHHGSGDDPVATLHRVARIVTDALDIERFSVWCATDDREAIRLYFLYCRSRESIANGTILRNHDFPSYFGALDGRTISIEDVDTDPAAADLLDSYLRPLGIGALLDAPLYLGGVAGGMICHEHVGGTRSWSEAERLFAALSADNVSRLFEEMQRQRAEQNLRVYQRELLVLNRLDAMGQMAAGLAHDFRNVLTAIVGNIAMIEADRQDESDRETFAAIRDAVSHAEHLVRELTAFGRDVSGRPKVLSLRGCVDQVVRLAAPTLGECTIEVRQAGDVSQVFIDGHELERVLLNLINNARDAMSGGGTIRIDIAQTQNDSKEDTLGRAVSIAVTDVGVGMDATTRARAFEPYFTNKAGGTGLGLAVARHIVTRAGGLIDVESELGVGTRVRVILPAID